MELGMIELKRIVPEVFTSMDWGTDILFPSALRIKVSLRA